MSLFLHWKRLVSRLWLVNNYCKRCGLEAEPFTVDDELYQCVVSNGEELCFRCFHSAACRAGFHPVWRVRIG